MASNNPNWAETYEILEKLYRIRGMSIDRLQVRRTHYVYGGLYSIVFLIRNITVNGLEELKTVAYKHDLSIQVIYYRFGKHRSEWGAYRLERLTYDGERKHDSWPEPTKNLNDESVIKNEMIQWVTDDESDTLTIELP